MNVPLARQDPTVVLVTDHVALQHGLEAVLGETDCTVVGTASDAEAALALVERRRPDVTLLDIDLPEGSVIELTESLLAADSRCGVLIYTGIHAQATLAKALDIGARGFVLKAGGPEELLMTIRAVAAGETHVDERLRPLLLARSTTERIGVLSPREREVLDLLAQGLNGEEVASRLTLSPETIRTHVRNAMDKLEAHTRVHAVALALREGEI